MQLADFNNAFTKSVTETFDNVMSHRINTSFFDKLMDVENTSTEGADLPTYLNESQNLPHMNPKKGYKVAFETARRGGRIKISEDVRDAAWDDTLKIAKHLRKYINSATYNMNKFVEIETHRLLNQAFTIAPLASITWSARSIICPDGQPILSANHQFNTGGTRSNLLAAAPLTLAVIGEAERRAGDFVWPDGVPMPMMLDTVIVKSGSEAARRAKQIFGVTENNAQYRVDNSGNVNIYAGRYTIIETPYITWANANTRYFLTAMSDAMGMAEWNPFFCNFIRRPGIRGECLVKDNLDYEYAYSGSFKFGVRNLPMHIRGSQWS